MTQPDPPLIVHKAAHYVEVPLDTDGTPLVDGDRCVEVEPGQWMHPTGVALMDLCAEGVNLRHANPSSAVDWDATLDDLGYRWCRPCAERHRGPECWVDERGVSALDRIDQDRDDR